jgi:hypothetical protein
MIWKVYVRGRVFFNSDLGYMFVVGNVYVTRSMYNGTLT